MNRKQRKDILETVGFVAIIASLFFVGLETRNSSRQTAQNTQAIEIAAYQELMNNISEWNALAIENRDAAAVTSAIFQTSDIEYWRRESALFMLFRHGDIAYFMYERGVIDEARLLSTLRPIPLNNDVGREFWNRRKAIFVAAYRQYLDRLLAEGFFDEDIGDFRSEGE